MNESFPTETAADDAAEELGSASSRIANGLGVYLDELAVPDADQQFVADLAAEAAQASERFNLMGSLEAARRSEGRTWQEGFASGTAHAFAEIVEAYQQRIDAQPNLDPDAIDPITPRVCTNMGRHLADLRFTACWRIIHSVRGTSSREESAAARGYVEGMEYALKRALTSFRARVEDRVTRALTSEGGVDELRRRLVALLYVAVTDATLDQIRGVLGSAIADEVTELDKGRMIKCTREVDGPPLQVTPLGAAEAYRLAREFEAA